MNLAMEQSQRILLEIDLAYAHVYVDVGGDVGRMEGLRASPLSLS